MSARREHIKRQQKKWRYIQAFEMWLDDEPAMWKVWEWRRWKNARPKWPFHSKHRK